MEYVIFFPICRVPSSAVNIGRKFFFSFFLLLSYDYKLFAALRTIRHGKGAGTKKCYSFRSSFIQFFLVSSFF